tara:strand:+ start:107 stop:478 length:372 start_codon:yes stop_codon:yes gene_type:complete
MIEVACGIIYTDKYEQLIIIGLRPNDKPYGGFWEFPGGKLEKGETIEECLKREWLEELNLKIKIDKEIYKYTYDNYLCRFFKGHVLDIQNLKRNVHSDIAFVNKNELYKYKLFENDKKIIKFI